MSKQSAMNSQQNIKTQDRTVQVSRSFDNLIVLFCGLISIGISFLILFDVSFFGSNQKSVSSSKVIGHIEIAKEKVLFRPGDLPLWEAASEKQELRSRDLIFTESNSSAKIALESEAKIELGEKTLLSIEILGGEPLIKVINGSIKVQNSTEKKIQIKMRNLNPIAIDSGATVSLSRSEAGQLDLKVSKGSVSYGEFLVVEGQKAGIDQRGALTKVQKIALELESPASGSDFLLGAGLEAPVDFAWTLIGSQEALLQISTDPKFDKLVTERKVVEHRASVYLTKGRYYWRVRSNGQGGQSVSEVRHFRVLYKSDTGNPGPSTPEKIPDAPKIPKRIKIEKSQSTRIRWRPHSRFHVMTSVVIFLLSGVEVLASPLNREPQLSWPAVEGGVSYEVEVARDESFQTILKKYSVTQPKLDFIDLVAGTYYLRVATISASGKKGPFSEPSFLEIIDSNLDASKHKYEQRGNRLNPIVLLSPLDGALLEVSRNGDNVSFGWKQAESPKCRQYIVELSGEYVEKSRTNQILKANVNNIKLFLKAGDYRWRVRSDPAFTSKPCPGWSITRVFKLKTVDIAKNPVPTVLQSEPHPKPHFIQPIKSVPAGGPFMTMRFLMAPGTYHYQSQELDPEVQFDAKFLNNFGLEAAIPSEGASLLKKNFGIFMSIKRLSAVLFKGQSKNEAGAQKEVSVQLLESELGLRLGKKYGDSKLPKFQVEMETALVAKEQGILVSNEPVTLSWQKKLTLYPKLGGLLYLGLNRSSRLFFGYSFGQAVTGLDSREFFKVQGVLTGVAIRPAWTALISEFRFGLRWESSQSAVMVDQKISDNRIPLIFRTTRKMGLFSISTEI